MPLCWSASVVSKDKPDLLTPRLLALLANGPLDCVGLARKSGAEPSECYRAMMHAPEVNKAIGWGLTVFRIGGL